MDIEATEKEFKEIKSKLKLIRTNQPSYIVLLVNHKTPERNDVVRLSCKNLIPINGYPFNTKVVPVGGYVYDAFSDCYIINCIDYFALGLMSFSYKLKMENVGFWTVQVPVPEALVKKNLDNKQKFELENFKSVYSDSEEVDFHFIQFVSAN